MPRDQQVAARLPSREQDWPVLICLLGHFRLLKCGKAVEVRGGGKLETLLSTLAVGSPYGVSRDVVFEAVWPHSEPGLASQSLSTLLHSVHGLLRDVMAGQPPILRVDGTYRLNEEAGIGVDVSWFSALVAAGERLARAGDHPTALALYERATEIYRGELCARGDPRTLIEREQLRAMHLMLLARMAEYHYDAGDHAECLERAQQLLQIDPCREDAHRLVMRCYARRGERAQAMHQFRLCQTMLRSEFDAEPEAATVDLFNCLRADPRTI